jgi:AraC family ethanolamine operon transcriptional activator
MCPSVCLDFAELGPSMLFKGVMAEGCYTMPYIMYCPHDARLFTFNLAHQDGYMGLFTPGSEIDLFTPEGYAAATLVVPAAMFELAVEKCFPEISDRFLETGGGVKVGLEQQLELAAILKSVREMERDAYSAFAHLQTRQRLEGLLVNAYLAGLRSGVMDRVSLRARGRMKRLQHARDFVEAHSHQPIDLAELCDATGMSLRGLQVLFRDTLGVSPHTYIRNQRLHGVRRVLLESKPDAGVIKRAALEWGFWHMGHFTKSYRDLFGETPGGTIGHH